jgi:hypothetical protein
MANEECPDHRACINYQCVDPCISKCGSNARCEPKNHLAVCTCPEGYTGDARASCRQSRTFPIARYSRSLLANNATLVEEEPVDEHVEEEKKKE